MKRAKILWMACLLVIAGLFSPAVSYATNEPYSAQPLRGNQLRKDSSSIVKDTVYFNPALKPQQTTFRVQNLITFKIDEFANRRLPERFSVTINFKVYYLKNVGGSPASDSFVNRSLQINYHKNGNHQHKATFAFTGGHQAQVVINSIVVDSPLNQLENSLMLENELVVTREYAFHCTNHAITAFQTHYYDAAKDELRVNWDGQRAADEYDLEWNYIDDSALANYYQAGSTTLFDPAKIFTRNAARVSIKPTRYLIPLLYDGGGRLFYRVRAVQIKANGQRIESNWSSDHTNGMGIYTYTGHENKLNWQVTTSFAEEGKRKSVVQYFDGSLRNRQTVTKDNTTDTTLVAETFYDYQGRPAIQVLPTPSLSSIIKHTPNFNAPINGPEYEKDLYDGLLADSCYCKEGAPAMGTLSGASKYYSPNNPLVNTGFHKYIPDAKGFPFSETRYTADNTGRIALQSGVGPEFQIDSNRATRYYYSGADQEELDALFGTEVGHASHYFKNMVRDANGQYSISYVDMHGRTIATALAGVPATQMDNLPSNNPFFITKKLLDSTTNIIKGTAIESAKGLIVTRAGNHRFLYSLLPDSVNIKDCNSVDICYDCTYDLEITITDDCNNATLPGNVPYVITASNLTLDTACNANTPFPGIDRTVFLREGNYLVTKRLIISKQGMDRYREVFLRRNTCKTVDQFIAEQKAALDLQCQPTCASCITALGTWETFRPNYMQQMGIAVPDTANYRQAARNAWNELYSTCEDLCNGRRIDKDYRAQMLAQVTAPDGEYADPDMIDGYSIFRGPAPAPYTTATYHNENGDPETENPGSLTKEEFAARFKPSWANDLLRLHPEYYKLVLFEQWKASHEWDLRFENTDTYQAAVDSGYLNPANFTGLPAHARFTHVPSKADPYFTSLQPAYKAAMQDSLFNAVKLQGEPNINAWSLATIMAHCPDRDESCRQSFTPLNQAFVLDAACSGELDVAWRYFREMYLQKKSEIMHAQLSLIPDGMRSTKNYERLLASGHTVIFLDPAIANIQHLEGMVKDTDQAKDTLTAVIDRNCRAYAIQWWQELKPCNFSGVDSASIIDRLIAVCKEGGDMDHIFGASTVKPASTHLDKSFEQVIKAYAGSNYNSTCNVLLLSAPLPYDKQPLYYDKPIMQKPDSCECATIGSLYEKFRVSTDATFSNYIYRTTGTRIYQGVLDTLRMACNGTINCNMLKEPLSLPPVLQCGGGENVCVTCVGVDTLYTKFKNQFPDVVPAYEDSDSLQRQHNILFEKFMNRGLGFGKSTVEYLDFMAQCAAGNSPGTPVCDSLKSILDTYRHYGGVPHLDASGADTTNWKVNNNTLTYTAGVPFAATFDNGIWKLPRSYTDTLPDTWPQNQIGLDRAFDTLCLDSSGFTFETRLRMPDSLVIPNIYNDYFWITLYSDPKPASGSLLVSLKLTPGNGAAICTHQTEAAPHKDCRPLYVPKFSLDTFRRVRLEFRRRTFNYYIDSVLVGTRDLTAPMTKIHWFSFTHYGQNGEIDYVHIYDTAGRYLYKEDFNDPYNLARPIPATDCNGCQPGFVKYFNQRTGHNYTYNQIKDLYNTNCGVQLGDCPEDIQPLTLCGRAEPVFPPVTLKQHSPCDDSTLFAVSKGTLLYEAYRDSITRSFDDRYLAKCLNARYNESFAVHQPISEYHYTLYYYDQAGNLVKTIPPAGVDVSKFGWAASYSDSIRTARRNKQLKTPNHQLRTEYRYNTLNQVVKQKSPDGGLTQHWYDRLGRLAISQNAKQKAAGSSNDQDKLYSYTQYDSLGRITEVGQVKNTSANGAMTDALSRNTGQLTNWLLNLTNRREQITQTIYDHAYPGFVGSPVPATVIAQRNLRNRVSYVSYTKNHLTAAFNQATFYTYDILGNVDTLLQDYGCGNCGTPAVYNIMNRNNNARKKIAYQYDLISGKVNMVLYQNGWNDMLLHRYTYDAENRLTAVETSNDSLVWEKDARYEYYRHGPLARTVLGEQLVQGVDYAYTLQGWLKGMNSTGATATHDMGEDGKAGSLSKYVARDALGFNLNYFGGDYKPINATVTPFPNYRVTGGLPANMYRPLYNGNISSMASYIRRFEPTDAGLLNVYKYDQLNRLTAMDVFRNFNPTTNSYAGLTGTVKFRERITYDGNGNIQKYLRHGNADYLPEMDSLVYKYYAGTNQLRKIHDSVGATRFGSGQYDVILDIDSHGEEENYVYDPIGNLIQDKAEKLTSIGWNVYGKIDSITRTAVSTDKNSTTNIWYQYDASGNRIGKTVREYSTGNQRWELNYTWYVRDAQGNILATYVAKGKPEATALDAQDLNVSDHLLYGSTRLGTSGYYGAGVDLNNQGPIPRTNYTGGGFIRGFRQYELTNHLGNVLTAISDRKIGVSSGAIGSLIDYYEPDMVSATDYYPFGMPSRYSSPPSASQVYKFGFNGKENDNEVKGFANQQDYGMRIYDNRVGRFLSVDPLQKKYPELTPYQFASNSPIQGIDLDGLEIIHFTVLFDEKGKGTLHLKGIQEKEWGFWQQFGRVFGIKKDYSEASGEKISGKSYVIWDKDGTARTRGIGRMTESQFNAYAENNFQNSPEQKKEIEIKVAVGEVALGYAFSKFEGMFVKAPHIQTSTSTQKQSTAATGNADAVNTARKSATTAFYENPEISGTANAYSFIRTETPSGNASARTVGANIKIINNKGSLAPIEVASINSKLYIINGHHRVEAAIRTNTPLRYKVLTKEEWQKYGYKTESEITQAAAEASTNRIKLDNKIIKKETGN